MSDVTDFCESFGSNAGDPDFMDNWLDKHVIDERLKSKRPSMKKRNIQKIELSKNEELKLKSEFRLSEKEWSQVLDYVSIFSKYSLSEHFEVNEHISKNGLWGDFTEIRSKNDHGGNKIVLGITRKYFNLVCQILKITACDGAPLIKDERY